MLYTGVVYLIHTAKKTQLVPEVFFLLQKLFPNNNEKQKTSKQKGWFGFLSSNKGKSNVKIWFGGVTRADQLVLVKKKAEEHRLRDNSQIWLMRLTPRAWVMQ